MVKNITIIYIDKVDKNVDGRITKNEIMKFWNYNNGLVIKPWKNTIIKYILKPIFHSGKTTIPKDEILKNTSSPERSVTVILIISPKQVYILNYIMYLYIYIYIILHISSVKCLINYAFRYPEAHHS